MIGNLQVLRAIAAISVVLYHTGFCVIGGYHTDYFGVAIFFVISGFIMCFIAQRGADRFFTRRLRRIVPLWLACLTLCFYLFQNITPAHLLWYVQSALFMPSSRKPMLGVGWTLNFEMYFYAVFAVALLLSRKLAPLIAAAFLLAVFAAHRAWPQSFLPAYYSEGYVRYFIAGIAAFYLWRAALRLPFGAPIGTGLATVSFGLIATLPLWGTNAPAPAILLLPALVVAGALLASRCGADIKWRPLILLGDASYAIYLTHTIALELIFRWTPITRQMASSHGLAASAIVAGCTAVGVCAHLWIERPLNAAVARWHTEHRLRTGAAADHASR